MGSEAAVAGQVGDAGEPNENGRAPLTSSSPPALPPHLDVRLIGGPKDDAIIRLRLPPDQRADRPFMVTVIEGFEEIAHHVYCPLAGCADEDGLPLYRYAGTWPQ